jgi:hypothetical protein
MTLQIAQPPTLKPPLARRTQVRVICEGCYGDGNVWLEPHTIVQKDGLFEYRVTGERRGYDLIVWHDKRDVTRAMKFDVIDHESAVDWCVRQLGGRA